MTQWFRNLRKEVVDSVKMVEIEERYDMVFSRPAGLFFAKIAVKLNMTPTQVSFLSMLVGCFGGALFLFQDVYTNVIIGAFCIVLAGILDSTDGQLARMTNQSSELGRVIDGLIDNIVFITAYVCAAVYLIDDMGFIHIATIAALGGAAHSWKSAAYELHKVEYLFYVGRYKSYKPPTPESLRENFDRSTLFRKFIYAIYLDYSKKQAKTGFRDLSTRETFEELAYSDETRDKFAELYRKSNQEMLYWWAWVGGSNSQRAGILISILLGAFDIYLYINILSMIPFYLIGQKQKREDKAILKAFQKNQSE